MAPINVSTSVSEFDVVVRKLVREAERVVSLHLSGVDGESLPEWTPGSHIDLCLPGGIERQYSLCSAAGAADWRVAVLDDENSRGGSRYVCNTVEVGDRLQVRGPRNHFALIEAPRYLFLAGGIGITPLLAMATVVDRQGLPWRMVYGGRTRGSMAFIKEIEDLAGDLVVWPQDDRGVIDVSTEIAAAPTGTAVYCCGPEPLIAAVEKACVALGRPAAHVCASPRERSIRPRSRRTARST